MRLLGVAISFFLGGGFGVSVFALWRNDGWFADRLALKISAFGTGVGIALFFVFGYLVWRTQE